MSLLIKNTTLNGKKKDVLISNGIFTHIDQNIEDLSAEILNAEDKIIVPSLKNGHSHAAMATLRGFADDMKLRPWLEEKIWPAEANITSDAAYWGARFAALEMIKSGTTFCNDMYFHFGMTQKAFIDSGIKSAAGPALFDFFNKKTAEEMKKNCITEITNAKSSENNSLFLAAHSIYTLSKESLKWIANLSREKNIPVHIHLSETEFEVNECIKNYEIRPVMLLEQTGLLETELIAAHSIWLDESELDLMAKHNVSVVHNPSSNMKLAVGEVFPYSKIKDRGINIMLGTDSSASNNNLDMFEEMKFAALLQKFHTNDPEIMKAEEIFNIATGSEASAFPQLSSKIEVGAHADCLLLDPDKPELIPSHNLISNLVYSANGSCVDTVICDGKILMEKGIVKDEEEILNRVRSIAKKIIV